VTFLRTHVRRKARGGRAGTAAHEIGFLRAKRRFSLNWKKGLDEHVRVADRARGAEGGEKKGRRSGGFTAVKGTSTANLREITGRLRIGPETRPASAWRQVSNSQGKLGDKSGEGKGCITSLSDKRGMVYNRKCPVSAREGQWDGTEKARSGEDRAREPRGQGRPRLMSAHRWQ